MKSRPIVEYERLFKRFGHDDTAKLVRFGIAHLEEILAATRDLDPALVDASELRLVEAISVIMDSRRAIELRVAHETFERAFPDLKGVYRFLEQKEMQVSD